MCLFNDKKGPTTLRGRIGWRKWDLTEAGWLRPWAWNGKMWHSTWCHCGEEPDDTMPPLWMYEDVDAGNGFHVFKTLAARQLVFSDPLDTFSAVGTVAMYGKAIAYNDGYRVEECVVQEIWVYSEARARRVRKNYPLCEVHVGKP